MFTNSDPITSRSDSISSTFATRESEFQLFSQKNLIWQKQSQFDGDESAEVIAKWQNNKEQIYCERRMCVMDLSLFFEKCFVCICDVRGFNIDLCLFV